MSEIKKQFYEVFGIEPEYKTCPFNHCIYKKEYDCDNCDDREWKYPEITDYILLNILKVLARNCYTVEIFETFIHQNKLEFVINIIKEPTRFHSHSEDFKMALLQAVKLLKDDEDIQVEVQALFEENN